MGKTYEQHRETQRKLAMQDYNEQQKLLADAENQKLEGKRQQIREDLAVKEAQLDRKVELAGEKAKPLYDKAAVQKEVDRQNIAERMSGLGLSGAGAEKAALAGADNRKVTTDRAVTADRDRTVTSLENERRDARETASNTLEKAKSDTAASIADRSAALKRTLLNKADFAAKSLYEKEISVQGAKAAMASKLQGEITKLFGEGITVTSGGSLKRDDDFNMYGDVAKRLEKASNGVFTVTKLGNIEKRGETDYYKLMEISDALHKATDGKFTLSAEGNLVQWY